MLRGRYLTVGDLARATVEAVDAENARHGELWSVADICDALFDYLNPSEILTANVTTVSTPRVTSISAPPPSQINQSHTVHQQKNNPGMIIEDLDRLITDPAGVIDPTTVEGSGTVAHSIIPRCGPSVTPGSSAMLGSSAILGSSPALRAEELECTRTQKTAHQPHQQDKLEALRMEESEPAASVLTPTQQELSPGFSISNISNILPNPPTSSDKVEGSANSDRGLYKDNCTENVQVGAGAGSCLRLHTARLPEVARAHD